ncbi:hypothetical protein [Bacillus infantis]|uniref:hypothetical protein n=1 Tax=Bacillus infantis TaxID=324767 RepID=UPI003CFB7429
MELVTGFRDQAHITAAQDGSFNAGVVGSGFYVLPTGQKLSASAISSNIIRLLDGDIVMQGRHITLAKGSYEDVQIANGSQGQKRNDLIVCRYSKDTDTGVESASLVAIQGIPTSGTPVDPEYNDGDILSGDTTVDMPLYRIPLDGLNVKTPVKLFTVVDDLATLKVALATTNSNLATTNTNLDAAVTSLENGIIGANRSIDGVREALSDFITEDFDKLDDENREAHATMSGQIAGATQNITDNIIDFVLLNKISGIHYVTAGATGKPSGLTGSTAGMVEVAYGDANNYMIRYKQNKASSPWYVYRAAGGATATWVQE